MPEVPNLHPGAPLTLWLRHSPTLPEHWYRTRLEPPEPDAVEYVRKDVCDAWLERAVNEPVTPREEAQQRVLQAALEAVEGGDEAGAERILRTCLSRL